MSSVAGKVTCEGNSSSSRSNISNNRSSGSSASISSWQRSTLQQDRFVDAHGCLPTSEHIDRNTKTPDDTNEPGTQTQTHWPHNLALDPLVVHAVRGSLPEESHHLWMQADAPNSILKGLFQQLKHQPSNMHSKQNFGSVHLSVKRNTWK